MSPIKAPEPARLSPPEVAPVAERRPPQQPEQHAPHGRHRQDEYAWLKTPDWLSCLSGEATLPEDIQAYLQQENQYTDAAFASLSELQHTLKAEMRGRMEEAESELPEKDGPFEYYWRYRAGSEQPLFARRPAGADAGNEQILLDGEIEARDEQFFELGDYEVSPDHRTLAWTADYRGAELPQLRLRDIATGKDGDVVLSNVSTVTWIDSHSILFVRIDEQLRASQVYRCCLAGAVPPACMSEELVFAEEDPAFDLAVGRLRSGDYVEIVSSCDGQDEVWLIATASPHAPAWLFQSRQPGLEYTVDHQGDYFYLHTNAAGAADFQIMRTPVNETSLACWSTWLKPDPGVMILSVDVYREWIVWLEQRDTLPHLCIRHIDGHNRTVDFTEAAFELDYNLSPEFDSHSLRFSYESPSTPTQIWQLDLHTGRRQLLKETQIPSGHNPDDYRVSRITAISADGTAIPVTCVYHHTTLLDGSAACVLEGYGSYGASMLADFCSQRLSLLDRGMVYALAHVRGGQEKGRAWYDAAKGPQKQNSFNDFIASCNSLVKDGYCRPGAVVALGRSAGGMLVGTAVNQAPELFRGIIADVPFVDVLNTLLDASHPLTPGEWGQWGNPLEDPEAYDCIAAYSPYDNTVKQAYPAILVTTALDDPRVGYWEAAKWVARLRHVNQGDQPVLLHTSFAAGHSGASGRFESLHDMAREMAFVLALTAIR